MAAPSPQQLRDLALDLTVEARKLAALVDSLAALGDVAGDRLRIDAAALRLQSFYTGAGAPASPMPCVRPSGLSSIVAPAHPQSRRRRPRHRLAGAAQLSQVLLRIPPTTARALPDPP